jgi:hypothetical protein
MQNNPIVNFGRHYIYRYIRRDKNEPFYIGLGTKNKDDINYYTYYRATSKHISNNNIFKRIVNKTDYDIEILLESDDYEFIKQKEIELIKLYGKICNNTGCLSNITDGGEGLKGYTHSEETIKKLVDSHMGKKLSPESQAKRIATLKEKYRLSPPVLSEEQKERLRQTRIGHVQSQETISKRINKISAAKEEFKNGNLLAITGSAKGVINIKTKEIYVSLTELSIHLNVKLTTLIARIKRGDSDFLYLKDYKAL